MTDIPLTDLERRAQKAGEFAAFPINLHNVRDNVFSLLSEVGRYGFFNEYTDHSFKHVLGMLETAEWIIPEETKKLLTPGDWLFLVLSIYLHDLGLLISRNEYENRSSNPEFTKFKATPPIPLLKYAEFTARLEQLPLDQRERIQYQEFVRFSHGQRIKAWVEGSALDDNNAASQIRHIISELFAGLDFTIKRDLGLVCESHTKDDIADTRKYKVSQPYGASADEAVNLQYIAVILRTVDLLQITKGRAPSVLFQVISPTDPVSQLEWQKQGAVRNVRKKPGVDRDGKASLEVQSDAIEVHARFGEADGFFGLTSYLAYAERELQACHAAVQKSGTMLPNPPSYPWKFIDSSGVEAAGFLTESFGFSLDQQKILDLLTGHTLYNDTSVVLRELTQNALDAVRLQAALDGHEDAARGSIAISWNSSDRVLIVTDNGTGISQEVIVNHLLKVGSSRYQDPLFKEKFPGFSPISRFGIGVLSTFMISDNVQITTCSPDDDQGRRIEFRSVHGKYLIKLLDKVSDRDELGVYPHGTSVRLTLRPTATIGNVLQISRMWLMFPKCRVTLKIDEQEPLIIGYDSPRDAIEKYLAGLVGGRQTYRENVSVREFEEKGVTLAFAVRKSELFKEWGFVEYGERNRNEDEDQDRPPIAVCIEGVGVEFNAPGFENPSIIAVSNAVGPSAPKTNVARSALEDTAEQREMLRTICQLYARHVSEEIRRLASEEGYSLSRAVGEAPYIAQPLWDTTTKRAHSQLMEEAIAQIPMIIVENSSKRANITCRELLERGEFWTVESPLSRSIETFVREAPSDITASQLLTTLGRNISIYPENTICNYSSTEYLGKMLRDQFEICEVSASESFRRINLKWTIRGNRSRWVSDREVISRVFHQDRRLWQMLFDELRQKFGAGFTNSRVKSNYVIHFPLEDIPASGLESFGSFISGGELYLIPGRNVAGFLASRWRDAEDVNSTMKLVCYLHILAVATYNNPRATILTSEHIRRYLDSGQMSFFKQYMTDVDEFTAAIAASQTGVFNPFAWDRRDDQFDKGMSW